MWAVLDRGALLNAVIAARSVIAAIALPALVAGCNDPARVDVVAAPTSCGQPVATALQGVKLHA